MKYTQFHFKKFKKISIFTYFLICMTSSHFLMTPFFNTYFNNHYKDLLHKSYLQKTLEEYKLKQDNIIFPFSK